VCISYCVYGRVSRACSSSACITSSMSLALQDTHLLDFAKLRVDSSSQYQHASMHTLTSLLEDIHTIQLHAKHKVEALHNDLALLDTLDPLERSLSSSKS
jgi:hypothetical protein